MRDGVLQVLLLDDDLAAAEKAKKGIEGSYGEPIQVWLASRPEEATDFLREQDGIFDAIVADIVMADGTPGGLEFAASAANRLPIIVISAYAPEQFAALADKLGPVSFLDKNDRAFPENLLRELRRAILWKTSDERLGPEDDELRHLCLARHPGCIMAVRFQLADVTGAAGLQARTWDFAALAVGYRAWEMAIVRRGGQAHVFHDQSLGAAFLDRANGQSSIVAAFEAFSQATLDLRSCGSTVFYQCPFAAALVPGVLVSGMFGVRTPGKAALVGRLGDWAFQIATKGKPGEVGVVRAWLSDPVRKWFDSLPGRRREDDLPLIGLRTVVKVTFVKPGNAA